jgi:hypothetical protein
MAPTPPPIIDLPGLYFGRYFSSSAQSIDSVYTFVEATGTNIYTFKIYGDSSLTNLIDSYTMNLQSHTFTNCNQPSHHINYFPPPSCQNGANFIVLGMHSCTAISIDYQEVCPVSLWNPISSAYFNNFRGEKIP